MIVFRTQVSEIFPLNNNYLPEFPGMSESAAYAGLYGHVWLVKRQVAAQAESRVHHANPRNEDVDLTIGGG